MRMPNPAVKFADWDSAAPYLHVGRLYEFEQA